MHVFLWKVQQCYQITLLYSLHRAVAEYFIDISILRLGEIGFVDIFKDVTDCWVLYNSKTGTTICYTGGGASSSTYTSYLTLFV